MSSEDGPPPVAAGAQFTVALLGILLCHEFGHFTLARLHRVNASLPFFIPMPLVSPFGTMGAVIVMKDRIKSRNAVLDIGASGPIAGFVVALPVLVWGLAHSPVKPLAEHGAQEGQFLLYWLLKRLVLGPIPQGSDVYLHPVAFAGWVGLFVTMLNLIPFGQLDGGHVAYALLGARHDRTSRWVRWGLLGVALLNVAGYGLAGVARGQGKLGLETGLHAGGVWVGIFFMLTVLKWLGGAEHPPTNDAELSPRRRVVAYATFVLFALVFMPTPWLEY